MSSEGNHRYFDILEVSTDATFSEIRSAYLRLKDLYSTDSVVSLPIADEFSDETRQEILDQIEEAYTRLIESFQDEHGGMFPDEPRAIILDLEIGQDTPRDREFSGDVLREIREKRGRALAEISAEYKVSTKQLERIEHEEFHSLPAEIFIKSYVIAYAKFFGLDHDRVVSDYMKRYMQWRYPPRRKR